MNRLKKLLAAATLLVLPVIAACGEDVIPPPVTGSIAGQVSIEGMGIDGVSVNLSNGASTTTAGGGTYRFDGVEAGAYTVTISGFPADASFDATSAAATIPETGGSVTLDFRGSYIRTASIMGTVTVENTGLGGVTVVLSGMSDATTATDMNGQYAFTGLRSGTYSVEISGFDSDEVGFGSISSAATVGVGESKIISFDGTYLRTAGIMGQVSVEGVGRAGVTVTMTGEGEDMTDVTDAGGLYGFSKLKAGAYSVAISGYDPDEVEFGTTSMNVTIALGETANIPFAGTLLRTSGISGRVSLDDGMGLDGVEVVLAGAAEATKMTANGGQYAFAGLAEGTYVVSMTNPDANAYNFETTTATIVLGDAESNITNFEGTHTRTASISGVLFIDEVMQDKMLTTGEPSITEALAPLVEHKLLDPMVVAGLLTHAKVLLRGPDLNTMTEVAILPDGSFTTGETLQAGSYQVELPANNEMVAAALAAAGVSFVGESAVVTVTAGGMETVNFPFRITMQTIGVGAVMGNDEMTGAPVAGVTLALYPTAQDAEDGTNMLGMEMMTGETGMAAFHFARDMDTSPGSDESDNLVFVKVGETGHDDLMSSGKQVIEVEYPGIARVHAAPAHVRLLNVGVYFDFWVKSTDAVSAKRGGDMGFGGWHTEVFMGEVTDESMPLMKPDPEDDMEMVNATEPTDTTTMGETLGKGTFSYKVDAAMLAEGSAMFTVRATPVDEDGESVQPDGGEMWEQSEALVYEHNGLDLPDEDAAATNDRGPIRITYTTQTLTVGVYREADDVAGFSDFQSRVSDGDHRPDADVGADMSVSVMVTASGRRGLEVYDEWDHDGDPETPAVDATIDGLTGGMASFAGLPADMDFTVQFNEGGDRVAVGGPDSRSDRVQAYGDDLDLGMSTGAFGDESGAVSEVELCPLTTDTRPSSLGDDDSDCATFAYQWNTGSITGDVGLGRAVKDLDVSIEADTDTHSEAPRDTETDKYGEFSWSGVQDGVYSIAVTATDDYTVTPKSIRVNVYHDEFEDVDDEDDFIGTPDTDHAGFSATKLRLSIKGYAANVSHETNDVVRGDETYEGAELELYAWKNNTKTKIDKTGPLLATATVSADGLYEFNDLDEGKYVIVAANTDDYEMLTTGPDVYYKNNIAAHTYGDAEEEDLELPYWDYENSAGKQLSNTHKIDPDDPETETFTFHNFALLHGDGDFSGRVREARGEPGGIAVEARRCETYVEATETCREETDFDAQTDNASSSGRWSFGSLREGWYAVNIAAATYNRAKWGSDGIDDDAANCDGSRGVDEPTADDDCHDDRTDDMFGMLEGKRAFNRGGATFYVYNRTLDRDVTTTGVEVEGTLDIDDGEVDLPTPDALEDGNGPGNSLATITWASKSITITPDIGLRATFEATVTTGTVAGDNLKTIDKASGEDGEDVSFALAANKTSAATGAVVIDALANTVNMRVVAENGYHDSEFSFIVSRASPADAQLDGASGMQFGLTRTATDGADPFTFVPADDEQRVDVPAESPVTGTTMSLFIRVAGKALQQGIEVRHNGTVLDALEPRTDQTALTHDYRITIPNTGDLQGHVVDVTVTSEDGVDFNYEMSLRR